MMLAVAVFAAATTGSYKKAHAFGNEVDGAWMVWLVFMNTLFGCIPGSCEDPLSFGEADGNGLNGDVLFWDVNLPYRVSENLTVGLSGGIGDFDTKWGQFAQKTDADVIMGGAFAVWNPMPDTRVTADIKYFDMDTDFSILGSTGSYNTDVWRFALEGSKRFDMGTFFLAPGLGVAYTTADRESFVDTLFSSTTPSGNLENLRLSASLTAGMPIEFGHQCSATASHCQPAEIAARVKLFYDDFSGISRDPTFPVSARPDEDYVGIEAAVSAMMPVNDFVSLGGNARIFDAGDIDGYVLQAVLNVDIQGWMERAQ